MLGVDENVDNNINENVNDDDVVVEEDYDDNLGNNDDDNCADNTMVCSCIIFTSCNLSIKIFISSKFGRY